MRILALAGGVGGAKLADGFSRLDPAHQLTVVGNTGDDFSLFGLHISPDLDTICYTLAGMENPQTGWGRAEESWETFQGIQELGGPDWFSLGNKDLAVHLERTRRLQAGEPLSRITADFCQAWGIKAGVIPMSDDPRPTVVKTDRGELAFQDYFVRQACQPRVSGFSFPGADQAQPAPGVMPAVEDADLVVICPSNPWVSIDPILAVPGIRTALLEKTVLAVSPLIGGKAVKGPAAKMFRELDLEPSAAAVAAHYGDLLRGFVIDTIDQALADGIAGNRSSGPEVLVTGTLMSSRQDRIRLAGEVLEFGQRLIKEAH